MIDQLILFGATGDLTSRKLIPALAQLREQGRLPEPFRVLGIARPRWDSERFRQHIRETLERHSEGVSASTREALVASWDYRRADVTDHSQVREALGQLDGPVIAYLSLPPALFAPLLKGLSGVGLPEGSRVVVEKPFGQGLESARQLNDLLHESFPERAVFRVDHFLHKQTVQNVLGLRFANRVFEYLWSRDHIERVEITYDEELVLEGRAGYYDSTGALKDMVQNHLLQLLALVAMEAPQQLDEGDLRDQKVSVLQAVRKFSRDEAQRHTVRGRYTAGHIGEQEVRAYVEEEGVDPARGTETFAQVTLRVENARWDGVPFVLRTGKALGATRREITLYFRPVPHLPFIGSPAMPNVLRLEISPDRLSLGLNLNGEGDPFDLNRVELGVGFPLQPLPAYAHVLLDVLEGDPALTIRGDEAEEAWRIVGPIAKAWAEGAVPLKEYPAGSNGPAG